MASETQTGGSNPAGAAGDQSPPADAVRSLSVSANKPAGSADDNWLGRVRKAVLNLTATAAVVAAVAAAYSNSLHGPFIFGDYDSILANQTIKDLSSLNEVLFPPAGYGSAVEGRPLLNLTFAINYALGEYDVFGYHVFNLIMHILNAVLLFGLVRRTLMSPRLADAMGKYSTQLALAAAAIWAVHPLCTQAVSYLSQRAESLAAFFYLLTLYAAARGIQSIRPAGWYIAAILTCGLGMACKETVVSVPVVVLLYDRLVYGGPFREFFRRRWWLYVGLAACWGVLIWCMIQSPGRSGTAGFGCGVSAISYALTQFGAVCHYLLLSVWPGILIMDYGTSPAHGLWQILPPALLITALLALTVWAIVRWPAVGFLGAAFFAILSPTSSFVPRIDLECEYRMYLPLAALVTLAVCAAWTGWRWMFKDKMTQSGGTAAVLKTVPIVVAFAVAACLGARTWLRNEDYRQPDRLWEKNAMARPTNARVWANWGSALREKYEQGQKSGQPDPQLLSAALEKCDKAVELDPNLFYGWLNRGLVQRGLGRLKESADDLTKAISIRPDFFLGYAQRAATFSQGGADRLALADWDRIVSLAPNNPDFRRIRGDLCMKMGMLQEALLEFNKAIELDPRYYSAYISRGTVWRMMSSPRLDMRDRAVKDFEKAIALKPDSAEAWYNLGAVQADLRQFRSALASLNRAVELKDDYATAYYQRGSVFGAMGRTREALVDFTMAVTLHPRYIQAYGNRARAYYELGQIDKAWADVHKVESLGGRMDPAFIQELMQAGGGAK